MNEIALDSLIDSLKVLALAFCFFFLFSFLEEKVEKFLTKKSKVAPLLGALTGLLPNCAVPILGSDLYLSNHISGGTLAAIFIASSDEALPILFSDFGGKWFMGFALIAIKVVIAFCGGMLFDILLQRFLNNVDNPFEEVDKVSFSNHCLAHKDENKIHKHFLHPLFHSLKIFTYAFIVTFLFHLIIQMLGGEENLSSFLVSQYYLSPLYSALIGLVPNCASSVILSETYLKNLLPFGALITGLSMNAGLGPLYLLKRNQWKNFLLIEGFIFVFAIGIGYLFLLFPLP